MADRESNTEKARPVFRLSPKVAWIGGSVLLVLVLSFVGCWLAWTLLISPIVNPLTTLPPISFDQQLPVVSSHTRSVKMSVDGTVFTRIIDGRTLALTVEDKTVVVWALETGEQLYTWQTEIRYPSWSPDGTRLAAWNADVSSLYVLDIETGERLVSLGRNPTKGLTWSSDGTRLRTLGGDAAALVWDAETGEQLFAVEGGVSAWSPDGTHYLTSHNETAIVWDTETGEQLFALDIPAIPDPSSPDLVPAWSPDGTRLVTFGGRGIDVWDAKAGTLLWSLEEGYPPIAWSPNGRFLATRAPSRVRVHVWDAKSGELLDTVEFHGERLHARHWSPDGKWLYGRYGGNAVQRGRKYLTDVRTWEMGPLLPESCERFLTWAPDGTWLACESEQGTLIMGVP